MTQKNIEVFQDLYVRTRSASVSIRDLILGQVRSPWSHDVEREKEVKSYALKEEDAAAQEKACQARRQKRDARRAAELTTPELARQRRSMASALQFELSRIANGVSQGVVAVLHLSK